ncbi:MAG: site-specific recombinase [Pseudonocardiales bacterium]|nr:site-specific recombinase [Pseudonocardiales bacterium]
MTANPYVAGTQLMKRAVLYLRVSTPRQMDTAVDIDADGNSISTQREFCVRRASTVQASIDREFIEPGNSAQTIEKRPVFRELLRYVAEHPEIDYVIIYMRSRAFRNFGDAVLTKRQLAKLGVKLISAKEDFGEGYLADAMEAVTDIFNEMEVRRNGEDIKAKLRNKALNGGTVTRAKLGYLNIRAEQDGRLYNSIGLDPKRAPLVLKAFELYATGEYSIDLLTTAMADLGLTTRPSARWPREQPVSDSKLHTMLSDAYYAGWVTVDGDLIPGRHEAIVSQLLFDRVQEILNARSARGQRDRILTHHLKGLLFCERCHQQARTSRLIYTEATGKNGQRYGYYLCRSRQEGLCDLPHLPVSQVEDAIASHYSHRLDFADDFTTEIKTRLAEAMADHQQLTQELRTALIKQLAKLETREERLIDLAADGALTRSKIQQRSNAIRVERARIQDQLTDTGNQLELGAQRLTECLDWARDAAQLYRTAPDDTRRLINQSFYQRFYLNDDGNRAAVTSDVLQAPYDEITDANDSWVYQRQKQLALGNQPRHKSSAAAESGQTNQNGPDLPIRPVLDNQTPVLADIFRDRVSSKRVMVELRGLEPLTPTLPVWCATSCATAPYQRDPPWYGEPGSEFTQRQTPPDASPPRRQQQTPEDQHQDPLQAGFATPRTPGFLDLQPSQPYLGRAEPASRRRRQPTPRGEDTHKGDIREPQGTGDRGRRERRSRAEDRRRSAAQPADHPGGRRRQGRQGQRPRLLRALRRQACRPRRTQPRHRRDHPDRRRQHGQVHRRQRPEGRRQQVTQQRSKGRYQGRYRPLLRLR